MYSYATRGLGFLVRCATISRQLGQGRQRSGGSPLFMLNICLVIVIHEGLTYVLVHVHVHRNNAKRATSDQQRQEYTLKMDDVHVHVRTSYNM